MSDRHELEKMFSDIDHRIQDLAQKLERHRRGTTDSEKPPNPKCQMVCSHLSGDSKLKCLQGCKPAQHFETWADDFPIDVNRLRQDMELQKSFQRYQHSPDSIEDHVEEASMIADVFAMPIAVVAIPEKSWKRAMKTIQKTGRYPEQLKALAHRWVDRSVHYKPAVLEELFKKMSKYNNGPLIDALEEADRISRTR